MAHTFLLEIGLEEIPAHVVTPSVEQLVKKTATFLKEQRLEYTEIKSYSTPRRLAVKVFGLADKQADIKEEAKGPAKKIAQDADGNWTKAAQGFARGQKASTDDIFFKELKGVEYVYIERFIPGKEAKDVLTGMKDVAMDLKFPTMMRWASNSFEYVRPIRWLVALLDTDVIPFSILNITTDRITKGHRFLGKEVALGDAADYPSQLEVQSVIADADKRKAMIKEQIIALANQNDWVVDIDADLLEEVNNLVEYPTVLAGKFDQKYLEVPEVVLITSMKDNQRYFYVRNQQNELLPYFITVRNGNKQYLENVISGNEKVLTARLEDAKFFFNEDKKQSIADYVKRLKTVMFHDKIGTVYQKMQRVTLLANYLGQKLGLSTEQLADLNRAAMIYKFDLVTGMVGEFSELQGTMGEIYARIMGEKENVAVAIREEYMPTSAEGELPTTTVGSVLSIADKLDSIQAFFSAGMVPSGSNDPYALRRQALGIVRIALAKEWPLSTVVLKQAVAAAYEKSPELYSNIDPKINESEIQTFIIDRLQQVLSGEKFRHDILETVVSEKTNAFVTIKKAAQVLSKHHTDADFKESIEALTRVIRLAKKAPESIRNSEIKQDLFENECEKKLYLAVQTLKDKKQTCLEEQYQELRKLKAPINAYFDETMIMVDDERVKNNRLSQLLEVADLTNDFGDLRNLNVK